jgi:hypothetical protein
MPLSEERRTQLDGILQQMIQDNESEENIQAVVADFKSKYEQTPQPTQKGFLGSVATDFKKRAKNVEQVISSKDALPSRTWQTIGQGAGFLGDLTAEGMKAGYRMLMPDSAQEAISSGVNTVMQNPSVQSGLGMVSDIYGKAKEQFPEGMRNIEAGANLATSIPIAKGIGMTGSGITKAAKKVGTSMYPKPTAEQALGQVLQGKTKDLAKGAKAFSAIDLNGVKTYADLNSKIKEGISTVGKQVDDELSKDVKNYTLDALEVSKKTAGGTTVKTNYVKDALNQLKELYEKTNNPVKAAEIDELLLKAEWEGITRKEVNDIARRYGSEYNAFNQSTGEQLTSVNKQMYENTRKGLKEVVRSGLDGKTKELDDVLSSLMNTQRLIAKNVEAANKLRQKVDARGLGEKIGRSALVALDVATLGTVKGAVLKLLPRGFGYKVKNYIDLEDALKRNLQIIENEYKRIK